MTMALAVALVACEGAVGKPGEPGKPGLPGDPGQPGSPGEPGGVPPRIDEPIPDLDLAASGEMATRTIDLNDHFFDPDGDEGEALTFVALSSDTEVVTADVSSSTLTLEAVAVGTAKITVRATDVDDLTSGADRFNVTVAVTVAPMVTPIPDTMLYEDDGPQTIALSEHFSHKNTITYRVVSVLPAGHVRAEIAEGTLTLTPLVRGAAIVVVEATADDKDITDDFRVEVEPGSKPPPPPPLPPVPTDAPTLTAAIGDMMLYLLDDVETIDLSEHFAHADEITYTSDVRGDAVDATIAGSMLTLDPVLPGPARVTVTAAVGDKSIAESFMVNVKSGSKPVVPKVAPDKLKAIPPQMIYQGDGSKMIDLTEHFSHANDITYETDVRGDAVDATVAGSMLTLDPVLPGSARVTVTAMADGMSSSYAFMVTVKAGTTPPPPPPEAIDEKGTISAVTVKVDETKTVNVADKFTFTEGVTYKVAASNANAMATVDASGMVSITGKKVGDLTLTVTATDARDNEAMQTIAVAVTPAGAQHKPRSLTIGGVGMAKDISLDEGQSLESRDRSKVTVAEKSGTGNLWTITAIKKGMAEVRIWNSDRTLDQPPIKVTVMNTDPKKKDPLPSLVVSVSDGSTNNHVTVDKGVYKETAAAATAPTEPGDKNRLYHLADVDFSDYFKDEDGFPTDIPNDGFKAMSNEPDVKVVGMPTATGVAIDVRRSIVSGFPLVIYVMDKGSGKSEKVTITVGNDISPIADVYEVSQDQGDGDFSTAKVYLREDKTHTLTVKNWKTDTDGTTADNDGFRFVDVFRSELAKQYPATNALQGADSTDALTATSLNPSTQPAAAATVEPYYTVSKTGPVEITGGAADELRSFNFADDVPTLKFRVTGTGLATVKFTYYVVVRTVEANTDVTPNIAAKYEWKEDSETLRLNIVSGS